ncbi:vWA domain-containing protein [Phosphitispora fastidiosa]|uniref:vWA domain-containing protein n=1 Tax=Phosphitispora fastidiosa TaxID=2837202 RepID=UPI001E3BD152|nr:VWA domain-containing protein [Phosphitispora fastidiosa]MBU7007835.1 magnesium chelatase subunit D [Phosphitispora fastidiosa]
MERTERHQRMTLEHYLTAYFKQNQGVRLGETTVISHKVHGNDPQTPGEIHIYSDQDAGRHYLNNSSDNLLLHMDVFHEPAVLNPVHIARRVWQGLETYLTKLFEEESADLSRDEITELTKKLTKSIILSTSGGSGNIFELSSLKVKLIPEKKQKPQTHVHILISMESGHYDSILFIADGVEQAILNQGFEIRRVEKIVHRKKDIEIETTPGIGLGLPGFKSAEAQKYRAHQNRLQIIMNLASAFGSIEDAGRFLDTLSAAGNIFLGAFAKKHGDGDLKQTLLDLTNAGMVKKSAFAFVLTEEGKGIRDFIREHQKELEAQVRKSIRRHQIVRHNYRTYRHSELKSRKSHLTDHKKVSSWAGHSDIAIPETVVAASARSFLEGQPRMTVKKKDLRVFGKKSFAPIDTCIAIDCSGSMVGEKIMAVSYLAEHFLLTSKEKVSVVSFQEMSARIVVPFTKNHQKLQDGLRTLQPQGLTPLAKGIVTSIELITRKRARNPLLVLITDGIPNFPLWTTDAQKDALRAAKLISENKIRLVCIGVIPNEDYMKELAATGQGNLYIVDELDKNSLVDVVTQEWEQYKYN